MKFNDNFNIFLITSMILFYFNKEFHSWMSFDSDTTDYETTYERLEAKKANDMNEKATEFRSSTIEKDEADHRSSDQ